MFNNILAWKDEVVGWMKALTDECHEHGCAVMIQLTHLGRRTRWDKADWLPVVSPSHEREPSHKAFPKKAEDWDVARIITDYADAAERMQAAGLDGIELQAYGHLMDQFWSPLTNTLDGPYGGDLDGRLRFTFDTLKAIRDRVGSEFIVGVRYTGDENLPGGLTREDGLEISKRLKDSGMVDFLNVVKGHIDTDAGLTDVIPVQGMRSARIWISRATFARRRSSRPSRRQDSGCRDCTPCDRLRQARHGRDDPRAYGRSAYRGQDHAGRRIASDPASGRTTASTGSIRGMALCLHNPSTGRESSSRMRSRWPRHPAGWSSWVLDLRGWRRHGSPRSGAMR